MTIHDRDITSNVQENNPLSLVSTSAVALAGCEVADHSVTPVVAEPGDALASPPSAPSPGQTTSLGGYSDLESGVVRFAHGGRSAGRMVYSLLVHLAGGLYQGLFLGTTLAQEYVVTELANTYRLTVTSTSAEDEARFNKTFDNFAEDMTSQWDIYALVCAVPLIGYVFLAFCLVVGIADIMISTMSSFFQVITPPQNAWAFALAVLTLVFSLNTAFAAAYFSHLLRRVRRQRDAGEHQAWTRVSPRFI